VGLGDFCLDNYLSIVDVSVRVVVHGFTRRRCRPSSMTLPRDFGFDRMDEQEQGPCELGTTPRAFPGKIVLFKLSGGQVKEPSSSFKPFRIC
jgi:hypothetical protein